MLKSSIDPIIDARFLELLDMYNAADDQEVQDQEAYHEYRLLLINSEKYHDYAMTHEMKSEGFQLMECCVAMDFMIFNSEKKKKKVVVKWQKDMYGISVHGKKYEMQQIKYCPWCGTKLPS